MSIPTSSQFFVFKDCLARRILSFPEMNDESSTGESTELDEFSSYLALESWHTLPEVLKGATFETRADVPDADSLALDATSTAFVDTLLSYGLAADTDDALRFLRKTMSDYIQEACSPPPIWGSTRTRECQICEREVPLTYHHLIPRSTHAKVLKRKWHPESMLNSVAWLCRPCHSAVHHVARGEDLAKNFYTIELLLEREDIQKWQRYAAKQRFGVKRG